MRMRTAKAQFFRCIRIWSSHSFACRKCGFYNIVKSIVENRMPWSACLGVKYGLVHCYCFSHMGLVKRKRVYVHMWTARTQIRLRIRAVWSGYPLFAKRNRRYCLIYCRTEVLIRLLRMRMLIGNLAVCIRYIFLQYDSCPTKAFLCEPVRLSDDMGITNAIVLIQTTMRLYNRVILNLV